MGIALAMLVGGVVPGGGGMVAIIVHAAGAMALMEEV
jgi:hypothetical protein